MVRSIRSFVSQFDRNLWILSIGWFVGAMGFAASIPFLSIYFHDRLGMSITEIGVFFGVMAVVRSVFQAVGGELSDRSSRTMLLVHAQIARALTFFLLAMAISGDYGFWTVAVLVTINSIFGAMFFPTVNALVSDILPKEKRLDGYAVTRAAGNLGWAAGPAIGGFLAASSYSILFHISAVITLISGLVFWIWFKPPAQVKAAEPFKFSDLMAVRRDHNLAIHCGLAFVLYLVISQLIAPFSVYTVEMVGISKVRFGFLFMANGLMVSLLQIPLTRLLAPFRFTTQLAAGSWLYFIGYGMLGLSGDYTFLMAIIVIVTTGEMFVSPPSMTLVSRLAPEGRMGRYMGVYGFFLTAGWSFGPLYGGWFLDHFSDRPDLAWMMIASLAIVAALGYTWFGRRLPSEFNMK